MSKLNTFGAVLYNLRSDLALTQGEIARQLKVGTSTVSNWENGVSIPTRDHAEKLAAVLNLSFSAFLDRLGVTAETFNPSPNGGRRAALEETAPQITRQTATDVILGRLFVYRLSGQPTYLGKVVPGASASFAATVIADADLETVRFEWAVALTETHTGFGTVDLAAALDYLRKTRPNWIITNGEPPLVVASLE